MTSVANEAAFFRFMENNGPASDGGKRNYLSWLRYVNELYGTDFVNLTEHEVNEIFQALRGSQNTRERYTSDSAVSDIKSALNKYLAFVLSNEDVSNTVNDIALIADVGTTTRIEIETRLGQGKYRKDLIALWRRCAVTEFDRVDLLIASHIKPWSQSSDSERIDPFNGLLLNPTLDKLFDRGYISFTDEGSLMISPLLNERDISQLGLSRTMKLYKVEAGCLPYLEFHREAVYVKQI
ncbi:MAG: HNH endonuclease [Oleibacter sp.]|nr:HNH endonuclease [Thalassolituus sp.]